MDRDVVPPVHFFLFSSKRQHRTDYERMAIDRHRLVDWLLPHCEPGTASVMYPKGKSEGPGWVNGEADVE